MGQRFGPSPKPEVIVKTEIKEVEKKSGVIKRKIVRDVNGSEQIDEVETYLSDRSHESTRVEKPMDKKTSWTLIPKYSFKDHSGSIAAAYSYNGLGVFISSDKQLGVVLQFSY